MKTNISQDKELECKDLESNSLLKATLKKLSFIDM